MPAPVIESVAPTSGPAGGGDLVRLEGRDFAERVRVLFDGVSATIVVAAGTFIDVRTPPHAEGPVDVVVQNLNETGEEVLGERTQRLGAYRYLRPRLATETTLVRLVRELVRMLKRDVVAHGGMRVSVDYANELDVDGVRVVPLARVPALVLTGPRLPENRFYARREFLERAVLTFRGPEVVRHGPSLTVDLEFRLTGSSDRKVELLNLIGAVGAFLNGHRIVELPVDPERPQLGSVRWDMDPTGRIDTRFDGADDFCSFTADFVVRGFDLDEGMSLRSESMIAEVATQLASAESGDS